MKLFSHARSQVSSLDLNMEEVARLASEEVGKVMRLEMGGCKVIVAMGRNTGDADSEPVGFIYLYVNIFSLKPAMRCWG